MIDKNLVSAAVEKAIEGTDLYIVEVSVSPQNNIVVELDSDSSIDIDTCAKITRAIEADIDRDVEDYELEVGSAGLTSPLRVPRQFIKNIGQEVEILTRDGRKLHATLTAADNDGFTFQMPVKVKVEGKKRPETVMQQETLPYADARQVKCVIKF